MIKSEAPRPKLRVTLRSSTPSRPQEAQLGKIDGDDEETSVWPEFDNRFRFKACK
jgi:hypothetical protein